MSIKTFNKLKLSVEELIQDIIRDDRFNICGERCLLIDYKTHILFEYQSGGICFTNANPQLIFDVIKSISLCSE